MKKARRRSVSALRFCKRTRDGPPRAVSTDVNGDEQVLRLAAPRMPPLTTSSVPWM